MVMSPLQYETMRIDRLDRELRLPLGRSSHDIVYTAVVCWPVKYHCEGSPFEACDYRIRTLGLDGVTGNE